MKIELNTIYNMDCLEGMKAIPDGSVDAVICDLPYGTMKGAALDGWRGTATDWDTIIPTDELFKQYERVLRVNGVAILFSQEPYTMHLRNFRPRKMEFCYPMYWKKNHFANALIAKKAPVSYIEDLSVFSKRYDSQLLHPLRLYFAKMIEEVGLQRPKMMEEMGGKIDHVTRCNSSQFALCTEKVYQEMIDRYGIDKWQGFRSFESLAKEDEAFKRSVAKVFNLPEGAKFLSNVLEFSKDTDGFHPTQKPVALIRRLILTYTNEGDTVLDNCMGSGTTAIAAIRERRHFIGFELNKEYYDKAMERIKRELSQSSLNFNN